MRIKICGITKPEDAKFAEKAGTDAIGVVVFSTIGSVGYTGTGSEDF